MPSYPLGLSFLWAYVFHTFSRRLVVWGFARLVCFSESWGFRAQRTGDGLSPAVLLGGDSTDVAKARNRAARTLPVIVGFTVGCGLGAACEAALGTWSLALPAGLAMLAFAIGFAAELDDGPH
jgi:hypothetical protein